MSQVLESLRRRCPQMWRYCRWEFQPGDGDGWSGILHTVTTVVDEQIVPLRKNRADALRYNRDLRRAGRRTGYKTVEPITPWPRIMAIGSTNMIEGPLQYEVAWTSNPTLDVVTRFSLIMSTASRMSAYVCRWCGSGVTDVRDRYPFGQSHWHIATCTLCRLEIESESGVTGIGKPPYWWNKIDSEEEEET